MTKLSTTEPVTFTTRTELIQAMLAAMDERQKREQQAMSKADTLDKPLSAAIRLVLPETDHEGVVV